MRRLRKIESKKKKFTLNFISLYIITTVIVIMFSASRYQTTYIGENNAKVAKPIVSLTSENSNFLLNIDPMSLEKNYEFEVKNIKEEDKSDVSMEYILKIETLNNLPLEFEIYRIDDIEEKNNLLEGNGNVTERFLLSVEDECHSYKLKITWREEENSYLYANTLDYVQIILESEQKD